MASAQVSVWASRKVASSSASTPALSKILLEASSYHITPAHPAWFAVGRRFQHTHTFNTLRIKSSHDGSPGAATTQAAIFERWRKNVGRIYARRVLELAAASAATQRFVAELEGVMHGDSSSSSIAKPADWHNWERKEWTDELLRSIGNNKISRAYGAISRICSLACLAAPLAILYPLSRISQRAEEWSWSYALWGIERAGPTFTKLTQWATTRHDLFSPEFCRYFGKLQDRTIGHAWKDTLKIIQEELGETAEFLQLETEPIGSGCIAQVYRGALTRPVGQFPEGTDLAIKIQHPGVWTKVCLDFYIMAKGAQLLEDLPYLNLKYLSLVDTVNQFRDVMLPQLDLTLEAKHLQRFNRDFSNNDRVCFPNPLHELTTTRVLTETFMPGTPILEYARDADYDTRKEIALLGLETTLRMIFLSDFLHADAHPGNLLISNMKHSKHVKLTMLDCGLVIQFGPDQHVNLTKILGSFVRQDGRLAGQLMVDMGSSAQASQVDVDLFVEGIYNIVEADKDNNFVEKVGDYITDICFLACRHKVKLEPAFVNAALAVEIMEGIASKLCPDIMVVPVALPLVVKAELMHNLPKFSLW